MRAKKEMRLRSKMLLGFGAVVICLILVGGAGYLGAKSINHELVEISSHYMPSIEYLIEADRDLQQLLVAERSMIFADAKADTFKGLVEEYHKNFEQAESRFAKYVAMAKTKEEKALIQAYTLAKEKWLKTSTIIVDGRKADTRAGRRLALDYSLGQAAKEFEAMRDYLVSPEKLHNMLKLIENILFLM